MALRLAIQRGGNAIDDPFSWMSSLSRKVLDYWEAYYSIEPFGDQPKQAAESNLWLYRIWTSNHLFSGKPPELTVDSFMPEGYRPPIKPIQSNPVTPEQEQAAFCAAFGIEAK